MIYNGDFRDVYRRGVLQADPLSSSHDSTGSTSPVASSKSGLGCGEGMPDVKWPPTSLSSTPSAAGGTGLETSLYGLPHAATAYSNHLGF